MSEYREIITKAVVAKGRKFTQCTNTISPEKKPSSILGGWIINHKYDAEKIGKTVEIEGYYDINVWYSYADNTKTEVVTERVKYVDVIKLRYRDNNYLDDEHEVIAKVLQQPNCLEVTISPNGNKIVVQAEREFLAEVVGETKLMSAKTELPIFFTFTVLIFSEHFFGIWGLIIGIPIFVFLLDILDVTNKEDRSKGPRENSDKK